MNFGNLASGFGMLTNPLHTLASGLYGAVMDPNVNLIPGVGPNEGGRTAEAVKSNYVKPTSTWSQPTSILGDQTSGPFSGSGSGGSAAPAAPAYDRNVLAQFDQSENIVNSSLGRLDNQLGIAKGNISDQYNNQVRDQDTQKANALGSYNTSSTQNSQNLRTNKNTITDQASNGLRGLLRMLGSYGAAGSSDADIAGRAVADQASAQRAGAGQTFAGNQSDLDTNWGNFQSGFESNRRGLDNWKQNNLNQVESQSLSTRQDLLSKLAEIKGQRGALIGGSYAGSAQPYLDQANGLSGRIDELGRSVQGYTGAAPTYQSKDLSSYDTGSGTAGLVSNGQEAGMGLNTPYLSLLLGRDKQRQSPFGF